MSKLLSSVKTVGTFEAAGELKLSKVAPTVGYVWKATNVDGTGAWAAESGGSGDGMKFPVQAAITADHELTATDGLVEVDATSGAVTISTPTWSSTYAGRWWAIQSKNSTNTVTVRAKVGSGNFLDGVSEGSITLGTGDRMLIMGGNSGNNYWSW